MLHAFLYGAAMTFGLIIPLGVQNIFVFNQGASQAHYSRALPSVLTAFICDTILIVCAVTGVSLIVLTLPWLKNIFFVIGILFLSYMGFVTWNAQRSNKKQGVPLSAKRQIGFAASVSILNPHAIIDTIGVIGTNALQFSHVDKIAYTVACCCVSFCWFNGLAIAGHYLNHFDQSGKAVAKINQLSALVMWCIAAYLVKLVLLG